MHRLAPAAAGRVPLPVELGVVSEDPLLAERQPPRRGQARRSFAISSVGLPASVWSRSHPCFLAVESSERITAKSSAPCSERNPPDIFCRNFIIRPSRSARLLVNGTIGSVRKRSTSSFRVLSRSSRL